MDKPPAEPEPSAFDAEAKKLDDRLRELISDYAALFLRHPHAEGRPSREAYDKARVLAALRVHPWRQQLAAQALTLERESLKAAGVELRPKEDWWERSWIEGIPAILERCEWDVPSVARNLITTMPASLRLRCPGYPGSEDRDAFSAAAVAVESRIRDEVQDSKRCQDPDALAIGQKALEAMDYKDARHLRLFRPQ